MVKSINHDYTKLIRFGRYLRGTRERKGKGLSEVARAAGITPSFLSQLERGHHKRASCTTLLALAEALEYPSKDEFLARAGIVSPDLTLLFEKHPNEVGALVFEVKDLNRDELHQVVKHVQRYLAGKKQQS